jgi:protein O-GlcNAc transferase
VSYLGFPGTMGAAFMDYLISDRFVVPESMQPQYAERIAYLPECFQANDDRRPRGFDRLSRADVGLPDQSVVLCSFNGSFKLNPLLFDTWCRILRENPSTVLWVLADTPSAQENLKREAAARGVHSDRLVFAGRMSYEDYMSRMRLADLFLDTFPFNGGTTTSDALWMGVPVLTCTGESFASRMAGSLLTVLGLPELVTSDLPAYERRAIELIESPSRLAELRARLGESLVASPLYKAERFCRHLERAYRTMWERHESGLPPESFSVPRLD